MPANSLSISSTIQFCCGLAHISHHEKIQNDFIKWFQMLYCVLKFFFQNGFMLLYYISKYCVLAVYMYCFFLLHLLLQPQTIHLDFYLRAVLVSIRKNVFPKGLYPCHHFNYIFGFRAPKAFEIHHRNALYCNVHRCKRWQSLSFFLQCHSGLS